MPPKNEASTHAAEIQRLKVGGWCVAAILLGFAVLGLGLAMTWSTGWGASLIAPGATLSAAGLAGLVASRSVIRWSEQRHRDSDAAEYRHREEVYGEIVEQMTAIFSGGVDSKLDVKVRSIAALWADPATVEALARWREAIGPVMRRGGVVGELKEPILTAYYEVVVAMRTERGGTAKLTQPSREFLLATIFDDRPPLAASPFHAEPVAAKGGS